MIRNTYSGSQMRVPSLSDAIWSTKRCNSFQMPFLFGGSKWMADPSEYIFHFRQPWRRKEIQFLKICVEKKNRLPASLT